jgi:hypothetical protein
MSNAATVILDNQYKGDTYDGVQFTLLGTGSVPIDLTGAAIKSQFRHLSKTGRIVKEVTDGAGITVSDAVNGIFQIDSFIIDWAAATYYYDIEITFLSGVVRTYIQGTLTTTQDVTNG